MHSCSLYFQVLRLSDSHVGFLVAVSVDHDGAQPVLHVATQPIVHTETRVRLSNLRQNNVVMLRLHVPAGSPFLWATPLILNAFLNDTKNCDIDGTCKRTFYSQCHRFCERHLWFFSMETLTPRIGVQPILPVKVSITIDTVLNVSGDFEGHGKSYV